jgi:hypothetical protein
MRGGDGANGVFSVHGICLSTWRDNDSVLRPAFAQIDDARAVMGEWRDGRTRDRFVAFSNTPSLSDSNSFCSPKLPSPRSMKSLQRLHHSLERLQVEALPQLLHHLLHLLQRKV